MNYASRPRSGMADLDRVLALTCLCLVIAAQARAQTASPSAQSEPAPPAAAEASQNPPPVAEPASEEADAAAAALAQAELLATANADNIELRTAAETPSITAYGFADFSVHAQNTDSLPVAFAGYSPTFFVGNLNVYLRADLTHGWKSLAEVRFMYLPNGNVDPSYQRVATTASDYVEFYSSKRWGGISIERAWLEYTAHPLLTVRAGHFLTPLGIWNVDHGTPTIISAIRPFIIGSGMFPSSQTGFEVYGSQYFGDTTLGYHLTLSNGRGNVDTYADMDQNKAIGGRVFATFNQIGALTLGASVYAGRATDAGLHYDPTLPPPPFARDVLVQYDEFVYALDLLWKYERFHLQSEFISQAIAYTDAGRPTAGIPTYPGSLMPDDIVRGFYALAAYELPWLHLMPFLQVDYTDFGSTPYLYGLLDVRGLVFGPGLNYRPVETVTMKAQYYEGRFQPFGGGGKQALRIFRFTTAWSF